MHYNVLPPEVKQDLRKEYRLRLITVGVLAFSGLLFLLLFSLFPAFIAISAKEGEIENEANAIQKLKQNDATAQIVKELTLTKSKIDALAIDSAPHIGSEVIKKVVDGLVSGVSIQSILYQPQGKGHMMTITGTAATRDSLLAFQSSLERTAPFQKANIPVDELAKSTEVSFTITLTGNF